MSHRYYFIVNVSTQDINKYSVMMHSEKYTTLFKCTMQTHNLHKYLKLHMHTMVNPQLQTRP